MKPIFSSFISISLSAICLLAGTTGCSLLNKQPSNVVKGSDGIVTSERQADKHSTNIKPLAPPKNNKKKDSDSQAGMPAKSRKNTKVVKNNKKNDSKKQKSSDPQREEATRRESLDDASNITIPCDNESEHPHPLLQQPAPVPSDFSINGEWTIYSVRGNLVTGEERPYINFDLAANRFYGSNGCNYLNGDLSLEPKGGLKMDNMVTTMKMCQDAEFEYLINLAVSDVRSFSVRPDGSETYLDMKSASGNTIMVLRRHNMDFLNGAWRIDTLNGTKLNEADDATITINIPDQRIHGCTGCNIFNGNLFIDPDKKRSMQFANISTTRKSCPNDSRETELLLGLEEVEHAKLTSKDTVEMYGKDGQPIMMLSRMALSQNSEK